MNYIELKNQYNRWLRTLGFSSSIQNGYTKHVGEFLQYLQQHKIVNIKWVKKRHIDNYFEYLQTRKNKRNNTTLLSVAHLNKNFDAIDKFIEFLHQMGVTKAPQPTKYRIKQDKQHLIDNIQPFTQQEIKQLQATINCTFARFNYQKREKKHQQLQLIFALYYACGLRKTEAHKLTLNDIDFDKKILFVKQAKGYKDRIIPLSDNVNKALQNYIYNFRHLQKVPHKRLFIDGLECLEKNLKELQKQTNDKAIQSKRLSFHSLRHSIATHLLQNGMPIESIAKFLGHSTLDSTQIYTHILQKL